MTRVLRSKTKLLVPQSVCRRAGMKAGDQLEFTASKGVITIKAVTTPSFRSVRAELAAIRGVETGIAGEGCITLADLLRGLDLTDRADAKTGRKVPRQRLEED